MKTPLAKQLYQTEFRVRHKPDHPKADVYAFGKLFVWTYGHDHKSANELAIHFAFLLPFHVGACKTFLFDPSDFHELPDIANTAKIAEILGANFALIHYPKGIDEEKVFGNWPFLVPPLNVD